MWYASDHELFLSSCIIFCSHHSGTNSSFRFHLSKYCFQTVKALFLDVSKSFESNLTFLILSVTSGLHLLWFAPVVNTFISFYEGIS